MRPRGNLTALPTVSNLSSAQHSGARATYTAMTIIREDTDYGSYHPWKDPPELKARTINRVRNFLKAHLPAIAAR